MRTANLAIVFTDVPGFTERASRMTLEEHQRLLAKISSLVQPLFRAFGGKVVKQITDAFLVTFESPTQALLAGVAIQDALWSHNRSAPAAEQFTFRYACNVGEVRVEGGDVFGEPVNIASRVLGVSEEGEVYFTEAVHLAMNKAEVPAEEKGAYELKGIPGKVKVFHVPKAPYRIAAPAAAKPLASGDAMPPFGNIGLSRVPTGAVVETVRARAAAVPRKLWMAAGGVLLALVIAFTAFSGSSVESAIADVEKASATDRPAKVEAARREVLAIKDPGTREYWIGRLEEAREQPAIAVAHYRASSKTGDGKATRRLIELLDHTDCRVRSEAADALGALKIDKAKGRLEELAQAGGSDDGPVVVGPFGCNSRIAAERALEELKAP